MTVHHTLTIYRPGTGPIRPASPVSNPPDYYFEFADTPARMHPFGHIWLNNRNPAKITIELEIVTPKFVFKNNGPGTTDGSPALFISLNPTSKTSFLGSNGAFTNPTLDSSFTTLTFSTLNVGGLFYYYQLNVIDQDSGNRPVTWDPIIVNQP
jgi:hypothetical protein